METFGNVAVRSETLLNGWRTCPTAVVPRGTEPEQYSVLSGRTTAEAIVLKMWEGIRVECWREQKCQRTALVM